LGKRAFELTIANAIWAQQGFPWRKEFANLLAKNYGSGLIEVDFSKSEAARTRINEWVERATQKTINNLIGPGVITGLTRMVLANAIYFKGNWQYQFDTKATKDAPFTRLDSTKVDAPLMHQTAEFKYGQAHIGGRTGGSVQFLELPYAGQSLSMLVLLPGEPRMAERLALYLKDGNFIRTEMKKQRVKVWLPRFKAESEFLLNQPLMDMGMKQAFGSADFSGMSSAGKNLPISHVLHKAFVDVNEEGTEASAATAVVIKERSLPRETIFRADRPFVYVIRDNKTGAALFMGRYMGPVA
jgi:serpin B